jgi:hypothetical protein
LSKITSRIVFVWLVATNVMVGYAIMNRPVRVVVVQPVAASSLKAATVLTKHMVAKGLLPGLPGLGMSETHPDLEQSSRGMK